MKKVTRNFNFDGWHFICWPSPCANGTNNDSSGSGLHSPISGLSNVHWGFRFWHCWLNDLDVELAFHFLSAELSATKCYQEYPEAIHKDGV